jgi:hypothetical protein
MPRVAMCLRAAAGGTGHLAGLAHAGLASKNHMRRSGSRRSGSPRTGAGPKRCSGELREQVGRRQRLEQIPSKC